VIEQDPIRDALAAYEAAMQEFADARATADETGDEPLDKEFHARDDAAVAFAEVAAEWVRDRVGVAEDRYRSTFMSETARKAVDSTLHAQHTRPHNIATVSHGHARRFMAEDYGISVEDADTIRAVMIQAADTARLGAGEGARRVLDSLLRRADALNETVDSLTLDRFITDARAQMETLP
jgi:NADH dehydrogenase/NADH:ubiquinone oxidoreductase subunit G